MRWQGDRPPARRIPRGFPEEWAALRKGKVHTGRLKLYLGIFLIWARVMQPLGSRNKPTSVGFWGRWLAAELIGSWIELARLMGTAGLHGPRRTSERPAAPLRHEPVDECGGQREHSAGDIVGDDIGKKGSSSRTEFRNAILPTLNGFECDVPRGYRLVSSAAVELLTCTSMSTYSCSRSHHHSQTRGWRHGAGAAFPAAKLRSFSLNRETDIHGVVPSPPKHTRHITTYTCDILRVITLCVRRLPFRRVQHLRYNEHLRPDHPEKGALSGAMEIIQGRR